MTVSTTPLLIDLHKEAARFASHDDTGRRAETLLKAPDLRAMSGKEIYPMSDTTARTSDTLPDDPLVSTLIRDLVEVYPGTMTILAPLGIDLCCGGGQSLGEALLLHGIDQNAVLPQIREIIQTSATGRR